MYTAFTAVTWNEAARSFGIHIKATRAHTTYLFYINHINVLSRWADKQGISLNEFTKRRLDEFLSERSDAGISKTTLHHDALCATVFTKWCSKNDLLERNSLAEYQVRKAPRPHKYMPSDEDMSTLFNSLFTFWDVEQNPNIRFESANKRSFHRDRNVAIVMTLLDSACRIGEVLALKMDDYQASSRQLTVRESKGREPRSIPVSKECESAISDWLKIRARVMKEVPKDEDEGFLFISETGGKVDDHSFLRSLHKVTSFAGLSKQITLHSLRRFSLNRLAKHNLLSAQAIAGHKDTKTTLIYTRIDPDFVREMHEQVGVVRGIMQSKRSVQKRRLV